MEDIHLSEIHSAFDVKMEDKKNEHEIKTCKICLGDTSTEDDFFVTPCNCKGTCEFVHYQCLKQWVESKISKK